MTFKVMTYNICSCHNLKYEYVPDLTIETIINEHPDIIGINEMDFMNERNNFTDMPKIMAERIGFDYYFCKSIEYRGGEYGNMIMSRFPIKSVENVRVPEVTTSDKNRTYENRAIIKALIDIGGTDVTVLVSHYGLSVSERINAVNKTLELIDDKPLIFMGDLNCTPDSDELRPIFNVLSDETLIFTHRSDKPKVKIDYIFTSSHFKVESAYVLDTQVSDHKPLIKSLNL